VVRKRFIRMRDCHGAEITVACELFGDEEQLEVHHIVDDDAEGRWVGVVPAPGESGHGTVPALEDLGERLDGVLRSEVVRVPNSNATPSAH
jgi:hypothetical protein